MDNKVITADNHAENTLIPIGQRTVSDIVEAVKQLPIIKEEDAKFLAEHTEHLGKVMEKTYIWRTDNQKRSIINDLQFPTLHSKFHQSILEQKVQFDQAMYLAKDFEMKKLEIEELQCDLEDLDEEENSYENYEDDQYGEYEEKSSKKRRDIKRRKIMLDISFKQYELKQMQINMHYRMSEIKGWQGIEDELLEKLRAEGVSEEDIWNKDRGEIISTFFVAMNRLQGIQKTTDSGEFNNLISIAVYAYNTAKQAGLLDELKNQLNDRQLGSLSFVESYIRNSNN